MLRNYHIRMRTAVFANKIKVSPGYAGNSLGTYIYTDNSNTVDI
jgi:hypothetical protein